MKQSLNNSAELSRLSEKLLTDDLRTQHADVSGDAPTLLKPGADKEPQIHRHEASLCPSAHGRGSSASTNRSAGKSSLAHRAPAPEINRLIGVCLHGEASSGPETVTRTVLETTAERSITDALQQTTHFKTGTSAFLHFLNQQMFIFLCRNV